jgi:CRP-like cAMP-binding protein
MSGLFESLPPQVWQSLLHNGRAGRHRRGDVLLRQGDDGAHVLLLTAGRVKVTRVEYDGSEMLLAVRSPREALGEISAWDGSSRSATVTALEPCITYVISAAYFRRTIDEFSGADIVLRHLLSRLREGEDIRAELAHPSAAQRVARVLLRLGVSLSRGGGESLTLDVGLSQEELARAVGLSRSSFAAELGTLRARGLVTTGRRRVVLHDLARLRLHAGEPPDAARSR